MSLKEKLASSMGAAGSIVYLLIGIIFAVAPLAILDLGMVINGILLAVILFVPLVGEIVRFILYVVALVVCISGPQDVISIIFYVMFVLELLMVLPLVLSLFRPRE